MGGTFNPIHYAHLFIAIESLYKFSLEKVIFVLTNISPLKNEEAVSPFYRLRMVELAIENESRFEVSDMEIKRGSISYTIDTLKEFKSFYGKDTEIYFLAGSDSAITLPEWKEYKKILELCKFIVFERPGFPLSLLKEDIKRQIIVVDSLNLDISSREIRRRIKEKEPIKYLLPPSVENYIIENSLYK